MQAALSCARTIARLCNIVKTCNSSYLASMRLRLPELLKARQMTAYALAQASQGRISMSLAYRMQREGGAFKCLSPDTLDALCEVLQVEPGDLFERTKVRRGPSRR